MFKNMYDGVGMSEVLDEDGDDDLQYDEAEIVKHYREFYFDVHEEFRKFGKLLNFKVHHSHHRILHTTHTHAYPSQCTRAHSHKDILHPT